MVRVMFTVAGAVMGMVTVMAASTVKFRVLGHGDGTRVWEEGRRGRRGAGW